MIDGQEYVLRVGEPAHIVDVLAKKYNFNDAAFITAYNPASQNIEIEINKRNQRAMIAEVVENGCHYYEGEARAHDGGWPTEAMVLILGLPQTKAITMAGAYGQYAYLWLNVGHNLELCYV